MRSAAEVDEAVAQVAALAEPIRRSLFRFVATSATPVSRDEAAEGVGVARHVAKFHLDKLVEDGVLDFEYRRAPGRSGPGAGRPAKRYCTTSREIDVSMPDRRYEFAGQLLAQAIVEADAKGIPVRSALHQVAIDQGHALGADVMERSGTRPSRRALMDSLRLVLQECGYEPCDDEEGIAMANCPFHTLALEHTELVCSMNFDLLGGLADYLERAKLDAKLDPKPGQCCVRLHSRGIGDDSR